MAILFFNDVKVHKQYKYSFPYFYSVTLGIKKTFLTAYEKAYNTRAKIPTVVTSGHQQLIICEVHSNIRGVHKIIETLRN
jgi:hypothetical protein